MSLRLKGIPNEQYWSKNWDYFQVLNKYVVAVIIVMETYKNIE
jgi:hypothetical protein